MTGTVDLATWSAVTAAHRASEELREPFRANIFPGAYAAFGFGDSDPTVAIIQSMLAALPDEHTDFRNISVNGTVDDATARAFFTLQALGGLPQTGIMDVATWNVLAQLYNAAL